MRYQEKLCALVENQFSEQNLLAHLTQYYPLKHPAYYIDQRVDCIALCQVDFKQIVVRIGLLILFELLLHPFDKS